MVPQGTRGKDKRVFIPNCPKFKAEGCNTWWSHWESVCHDEDILLEP